MQSYHSSLDAGQEAFLSFIQDSGQVRILWTENGKAHAPRTNPAGRGARIIFHCTAAVPEINQFEIRNIGTQPAAVTLMAGEIHPATDAQRARAEDLLAEAAQLASQREPTDTVRGIEKLNQAIQIWKLVGDSDAVLHAISVKAYEEAFILGRSADAISDAALLTSLSRSGDITDATERASALKMAGFVYAMQAKYTDALEAYGDSLAVYETRQDDYNVGVLLENRAKIERIQGDLSLALQDVSRGASLTEDSGDLRGQLAFEVEEGAIFSALGQFGAAYDLDRKALDLASKVPDAFLEATAWSDLGVVETELNAFGAAAEALDHSEEIARNGKNSYALLQTLDDRAELLIAQHKYDAARSVLDRGLAEAEKQSLPREAAYFLRAAGMTALRSGDIADAGDDLQRALQVAQQSNIADALPATYNALGDLQIKRRNCSRASELWNKVLALSVSDDLNQANALGGLARCASARGRMAESWDYINRALDKIEGSRAAILDTEMRLNYFSSRRRFYDFAVSVAQRREHPKDAFIAAERGRARFLLDEVQSSGAWDNVPAGLASEWRRINLEIARTGHVMQRARSRTSQSDHTQLAALRLRQDQLRTRIEHEFPSVLAEGSSLTLGDIAELQKRLLDPRTALVEYWVSGDVGWAWVITQNTFRTFRLPPEDVLRDSISHLRTLITRSAGPGTGDAMMDWAEKRDTERIEFDRERVRVGEWLLPHGSVPAGIRRLVIVPDGSIGSVPFAVIVSGSRYFDTVMEPSAAVSLVVSRRPSHWGTRAVVFENSFTDPGILLTGSVPSGSSAAIPLVMREGAEVRRIFGPLTAVYSGRNATPATASSLDWSRFDVAHFATHAILAQRNPELSGLVLNGPAGNGRIPDNLFSYADIVRLHAPLQLVVLSACDSAQGSVSNGADLLSLSSAFLAAGAQRVIGTLWPVDDEASSQFMQYFYEALSRSHSPSGALSRAQAEMSANPKWRSAWFWAGYTLMGNWKSLD